MGLNLGLSAFTALATFQFTNKRLADLLGDLVLFSYPSALPFTAVAHVFLDFVGELLWVVDENRCVANFWYFTF